MVALIIGLILIAFGVFAVLPSGILHWGQQVLDFLMGGVPILAWLIGFIAVLIGIADIKDRIAEKKERKKEEESDKAS